jgi:hypothetical protein
LSRIKGQKFNGDILSFSDEDRRSIKILDDLIYSHQVLRVYYTTYDMRRDQSSINPRAHADILVSGYDDSTSPPFHSCMYDGSPMTKTRLIEAGAYHASASTTHPNRLTMCLDFLILHG